MNSKPIGLLIAAGLSSRMGKPKALLLQDDLPFAIVILKKMILVCDNIVVVLGHSDEKIKDALQVFIDNSDELISSVKFVTNEQFEKGMFSSLKCGLNKVKNSEWLLYHFIDQPGLPKKFYRELTDQIDNEYDWIQPTYNNEKGHPLLLHNSILNSILELPDDSSLKEISKNNKVKKKLWDCKHKEILQDIDYPSDLKQL
ncbi:MAG: nucleotidyltransferase family protein [Ignavibacteriaceae bacterium]